MAETTADVRRDIEVTRERMSQTLAQLEHKLNLMQVVRDHPWPALALALGAGVALGTSSVDVKAAAATATATKGSSRRIGSVLDELVASLMTGLHGALQDRVDGLVTELKTAIGAPTTTTPRVADRQVATHGFGVGPIHDSPSSNGGNVNAPSVRAD